MKFSLQSLVTTSFFGASCGGQRIGFVVQTEVLLLPWQPGLILGYGFTKDQKALHSQTLYRCRRAARAFFDGLIEDIFIACHAVSKTGLDMATAMKDYLVKTMHVPEKRIHLINPLTKTNTRSELQFFFAAIEAADVGGRKIYPVVISSGYHKWRIDHLIDWIYEISSLVEPKFDRPTVLCCSGRPTWTFTDLLWEVVKRPACVLNPDRGKIDRLVFAEGYGPREN